MIATLILAIGLVLIIEGLVYALAPSLIEQLLAALREMPEDQRRIMGLVALGIGVFFVWIAKLLGA
ncbi:MAG: DUF2065 domain-containing protein [Pseudomonadota bacterium]